MTMFNARIGTRRSSSDRAEYQVRPSDHVTGGSYRHHVHGPIVPMEIRRPSLLQRLFGKGG